MRETSLKSKIRTNLEHRFYRKYNWWAEQYYQYYLSEKEHMITKEHLEHWIAQSKIRLDAMATEIDPKKIVMAGINVGNNGEAWVSFDYLNEKIGLLRGFLRCIEDDIKND